MKFKTYIIIIGMNKVIQNLIEQIVDLRIENKKLSDYKYSEGSNLKNAENVISNLKLEIANLRLIIQEIEKEKGND